MRSVDEMRAVAHEHARRRTLRSQAAAGAAAVVVGALVLTGVLVGTRSSPTTDLATESRSPTSESPAPSSTAATGGPRRSTSTSSGPDTGPTSATSEGQPRSTTGASTPSTTARERTGSARPRAGGTTVPTDVATSDPPDTTAGAGAPPPPPPTGPAIVTDPATTPTSPTTTGPTTALRSCTAADFGATDVVWVSAATGEQYPDGVAPSAEPSWFGVSVWAAGASPCLAADSNQELTITDDTGTVVYDRRLDGPAQLVEPGRWVLFDGRIDWDPTCEQPTPDGWTTVVCTPVRSGTFTAQLSIAGAVPPPRSITIRHG